MALANAGSSRGTYGRTAGVARLMAGSTAPRGTRSKQSDLTNSEAPCTPGSPATEGTPGDTDCEVFPNHKEGGAPSKQFTILDDRSDL